MSHRLIVQWNQWLSKSLGQSVLEIEQAVSSAFHQGIYGKHAILVGVPQQLKLLEPLELPCPLLLSPLGSKQEQSEIRILETNFYELPIASASVDLVLLPHSLELVDNPRQLLSEACRIVKPEGHIIIAGFNPFSLWGLKRKFKMKEEGLPGLHFLKESLILQWLDLSDFELVHQASVLYSPPVENPSLFKKLHFMEWLGSRLSLPCSGAYVLMAKAKVIPLTPIRMRWKQSLAKIPVPSSITGSSIRNLNQ